MVKKGFSWLWDRSVPWYMNFHVRPVTINGYVFLFLVLFLSWSYAHDVESYKVVYEDPCSFCGVADMCGGSVFVDDVVGGDVFWMKNFSSGSISDCSLMVSE